MLALKVPLEEAEEAKKELQKRELLDSKRLPVKDEKYMYFPILKNYRTEYEIVEKELPPKEKQPSFKEVLKDKIPPEKLWHLKSSQDIIGNVAIIEVSEELEEHEKTLGEALLETKGYLKSVYKKGKHEGPYRTQELKLLAGEDEKETIHSENGVKLKLNVETVYFSPRLSTERERITRQVKQGERLLVMFSGCGPFPVVIAKNSGAKEVVGVEINPEAHEYGLQNVELNKLGNVELLQGDVAEVVPGIEGEFDRVLMPAPYNANEYLHLAFEKVKENGTIHFYDFSKNEKETREMVRKEAIKNKAKARVLKTTKCGQVSPDEYRVCFDLRVSKNI